MFPRTLTIKRVLVASLIPSLNPDENQLEEYKKIRGLYFESGWERVKFIFQKDERGEYHPEMLNAINMAQVGALAGAFFGGTLYSMDSMDRFIRENDATTFFTEKDAHKKLGNKSILGFGRGALKFAPLFGAFFGGYTLFCSCAEAYRNKQGILEHTIGGFGIGAVFRLHFGIRGTLVGGLVGGTLGTFYGIVTWAVYKILGTDKLGVQFAQFAYSKYKENIADIERDERHEKLYKAQVEGDKITVVEVTGKELKEVKEKIKKEKAEQAQEEIKIKSDAVKKPDKAKDKTEQNLESYVYV